MSGKDSDSDGAWPDELFQQMKEGHEKFMRGLQDEGKPSDNDLNKNNNTNTTPNRNNPFVSFKNFVDANLTTLADNFRSFPTNISELKAKMHEEREQRKQDELDIWYRWTGIEDSPDHAAMTTDRSSPAQRRSAVDAAILLLNEAERRNAHVPAEKIEALYRDNAHYGGLDMFASPMLSEGGACYYRSERDGNLPSTAQMWRWPGPSQRWLSIDWFKRSPYSPVNLEAHWDDDFAEREWRHAFEDLVNASLGKRMDSWEQVGERPNGKVQSTWMGPGLDWMLSLQCRGILPPQLPSVYSLGPTSRQLRNLQLEKVLDAKAQRSTFFQPKHEAEFQKLVDEIATPAPGEGTGGLVTQSFVEEDLYRSPALLDYQAQPAALEQQSIEKLNRRENAFPYPDAPAAAAAQDDDLRQRTPPQLPPPTSLLPNLTGNKTTDQFSAQEALYDALSAQDVDAARACLDYWQTVHESVDEFVSEALTNIGTGEGGELWDAWHATLLEAMKRGEAWRGLWEQRAGQERKTEMEGVDEVGRCPDSLGSLVQSLQREMEAATNSHPQLQREQPTQSSPSKVLHVPEQEKEKEKKIDVLSSLTTTQTTRLPDGTVTTKVVLKRRFADGREEVEEKVHTYREPTISRVQGEELRGGEMGEKERGKKGWFWT